MYFFVIASCKAARQSIRIQRDAERHGSPRPDSLGLAMKKSKHKFIESGAGSCGYRFRFPAIIFTSFFCFLSDTVIF
jgi:hypothetical protein